MNIPKIGSFLRKNKGYGGKSKTWGCKLEMHDLGQYSQKLIALGEDVPFLAKIQQLEGSMLISTHLRQKSRIGMFCSKLSHLERKSRNHCLVGKCVTVGKNPKNKVFRAKFSHCCRTSLY